MNQPFMRPLASAVQRNPAVLAEAAAVMDLKTTEGGRSWYQFTAQAAANSNVADLLIVGDIGGWGISAQQFARDLVENAKNVSTIRVLLHSLGGDIMEGLAIYNMLLKHSARVEIYIAGIAASMGSVIAMAGDVVYIPENGWMMVHKPWGGQLGDANDMRRYADLLDQWEAGLMLAYEKKTGKSRDELTPLLTDETWMMGQAAVDAGFADQLTEAVEMSAHANNRALDFMSIPEQVKPLIDPRAQGSAPPKPSGDAGGKPASDPAPQPVPSGEGAAPATPPQPAPAQPDPQAGFAQWQQLEQSRRDEINLVFTGFSAHAELQRQCLDDMACTAQAAKDRLLAALNPVPQGGSGQGAGQQGINPNPAPAGVGSMAHIHAGNGDFVRQGLANALASRAGIEPLEKDNSYRGMALIEMARMALSEKGISAYGMDRMEMIGMAFTHSSSDFGNIMMDVAHKALLTGVEAAAETFQLWTKKGSLSDFKISNRVALDSFPTLDEIPDGGKYQQATINDRSEQIKLATYGKGFGISRQTIINDDLGAFTEIPSLMGRAAMRTIGNLVYALLMSNPKMKDGKPLFHADHGNLGDASALSMAALDAADVAMAMHEDSAETPLNIEPKFLITGRTNKARANTLMTAQYDPDEQGSTAPNTAQGMCQVITDARIDKAAKKANAQVPWFLAADAAQGTIEVAYLDGNEQPYLEQKENWSVDGTQFKVRHDAGVAALSHRTLYKNPGAAPA
ncbi:ClpP-like prohead protease/major capsid protein fusion protein [Oceanospirillum maris]|uniref:ClpP-like prohead protease/major capsid protein fusion protein n=1 Tax=Oceanospirillum maris TaxID=64977 RepID=UPI0003F7063D|nr:ClpP-like prohead protease/major capsid protein fusion protein [Oceanospirillum maris]